VKPKLSFEIMKNINNSFESTENHLMNEQNIKNSTKLNEKSDKIKNYSEVDEEL